MRSHFQPDQHQSERRYQPETVQKAVALAQQLERQRRETLSLEQASEVAGELNLDPQLFRLALAQVSAEEAPRTVTQAETRGVQGRDQLRTARILLIVAVLLAIPLLLFGFFSVSTAPAVAPPTRVEVNVTPPLVPAAPPAPPTAPAPLAPGN